MNANISANVVASDTKINTRRVDVNKLARVEVEMLIK